MQPTSQKKQQHVFAALCVAATCVAPLTARAQCSAADRRARPDSALARPFTDTLSGVIRRPAVATSRGDPKLAAFRAAAHEPRLRVRKEQTGPLAISKEECEVVVVAPGVGLTPFLSPLAAIPSPSIPPQALFAAPSAGHGGLFGGLLIGAVAAAVLGSNGQGGEVIGGTIGAGVPPGGGTTTPPGGGGGTTPGGETPGGGTSGGGTPGGGTPGGGTPGGGGETPGGGGTTPGGGTTTPPGGGTTTPPGGGTTTPPGGGTTTPPGGGTTPPGGTTSPGGGTTPPGGGTTTPPGGTTTPPGGTNTPPGGTTTPPGGGTTTPPGGGGGVTPPGGGGGVTPPGGGGGVTPPPPTTPVPEPATFALVGGALLLLGTARRRAAL